MEEDDFDFYEAMVRNIKRLEEIRDSKDSTCEVKLGAASALHYAISEHMKEVVRRR